MNRRIVIAGLNGFLAVAFAAFGAHGLAADAPDRLRHAYETGGEIQLVHAAVLAVLAFAPPARRLVAAYILILLGSSLFAGSLYAYGLGSAPCVVMGAPVGGTLLLVGWLVFAAAGFKIKGSR